jgi:hypothetical protein
MGLTTSYAACGKQPENMNEAKLLTCPFCGSDAVLYETEKGCSVMCQNTQGETCDIGNTHGDWTREAAIEIWNTRAGGQQPAAEKTPDASTSVSANCSAAETLEGWRLIARDLAIELKERERLLRKCLKAMKHVPQWPLIECCDAIEKHLRLNAGAQRPAGKETL